MQQPLAIWSPGRRRRGGQATVELVVVLLALVLMLFGLIDFGRAIYERQVLINLSREGSNLASRGTSLSDALNAVVLSSAPLNMAANGRVIITEVTNTNNMFLITAQQAQGSFISSSRIGNGVGSPATLPATPVAIPLPNQKLMVTEVFYSYQPITPIGQLLQLVLPTSLYDVAYF